jgi:TatD DNase family protein
MSNKPGLVDTHAHIHMRQFDDTADVVDRAAEAGVEQIVTVGVDARDSEAAVMLAQEFENVYATVGLHPHDSELTDGSLKELSKLIKRPKVVAIGECGLDYSREGASKSDQIRAFKGQIELALEHDLPMVWHVRDAWDDFFETVDGYGQLRGIVHCFTSNVFNMERAVERGFMVALNGIMTFTKDEEQLEAARRLPKDKLVLETDCPFLTPVPFRGKRNEPAYVELTAKFLSDLRGESLDELAKSSTSNARNILGLLK